MGIFNDPKILVESIRMSMFHLLAEKTKSPINLLDQKQTWSRTVPAVTLTHIWYQLLIEILKVFPRDEQAKADMIKKSQEYYLGQSTELLQIDKFRNHYTADMAIEWYTADSFVHKLVNKALRSENIDLLYAFRFFIGDLSAQIEQQNLSTTGTSKMKNGSDTVMKLFSGQQLSRTELQRLEQNVDSLISINGFFSTSIYLSEARGFADQGVLKANMQRVIIEISLNTSLEGITKFAKIETRSRFRSEGEVLFDCSAIFNVTYVEYDMFSEIWIIKLVAVPKSLINEHPYLYTIRETLIKNHSTIVNLGIIMAHGFGKKEEAIKYFNQLLSTYPSYHNDIPDILEQRGLLEATNGEHDLAGRDYDRALEIRRERIRENLLGIASIYSNIGILQRVTSDFQASLISHQEALNIYEQLFPAERDHVTKGRVNQNIGLTYQQNGMSSKALEYLTCAQTTYEQVLPRKHFFVMELLGHMGIVYEADDNFTLAVDFFHRQFNWSEEILPLDHPLSITYLDSLLRVYLKTNQTSDMNLLFSEHLMKLNRTLGKHHPLIPRLIIMVASLVESSNPFEAIRLYNQVLQINQDSIQSDRSSILTSHQHLAQLYRKSANLTEALSHATRALVYQQQFSIEEGSRLPEANELRNIGSIYLQMGSFTDALQYLTKSLIIYRSTYTSDHPTVQAVINNIAQAANQSQSN